MPFSETLKKDVRRRAHFSCCLCKALGVEIHHINPQEEGGPDTDDNAAPLCPSCHETYGANPQKRKFITEARDVWYEICEKRYATDPQQLKVLEDALTRIDDRVSKLVSDLDLTTEKIVNQLTGGNSYCRFMIENTGLQSDQLQLVAIHEGEFPLYDLQARIVDLEKFESLKGDLTKDNIRDADTTLNMGTLNPRMAMPSPRFSLTGFNRRSFNVFFTARNGTFTQLIRLCRKDGEWTSADKVLRDNGDVLWCSGDDKLFETEFGKGTQERA
jgi:HNH endonuclease